MNKKALHLGSKKHDIQADLEQWFQCGLGRSLLASQRVVIEKAIRRNFGFHQAEIGVSHRIPVGNPSNLGHKFYVLPRWEPDLPDNSIISTSSEIGLEHDSTDLVILHHALDFSSDPHQTLREASRILKPSGHLVIIGFNPLSSWGLRKILTRSRGAPWACRFLSGKRVEDWLNLLDFKVKAARYHFYTLPFNRARVVNQSSALDNILNPKVPLGAYYVLSAQKQVGARIRTAPKWSKKRKVVGLPLANRVEAKKCNL